MTLDIVDRAYLVNTGRVEFVGTPAEIRQHADLEQTYLGGSRQATAAASRPGSGDEARTAIGG
jgi:ABC-type transporter Mla maintaining outer membrane lipid asymmetry ATPase subunit MlaF